MWNGALEFAAWRRVHRAEELLVFWLPMNEVLARLKHERTALAELPPTEAASWAIVIGRHIDPRGAPRATTLEEARADLAALMNARHEAGDTRFESYVDLNRKAVFLGVAGMLLAGGLMIVWPASIGFLLAGAIGGFLSRLRRIVVASEAPTDYGASWVPLLLAPLVGALTGWAGIALVNLAISLKVLTLDTAIVTAPPYPLAGLALALLFGFAERLIDGMSQSLAEQVAKPRVSADRMLLSTTLASEQPVGPVEAMPAREVSTGEATALVVASGGDGRSDPRDEASARPAPSP